MSTSPASWPTKPRDTDPVRPGRASMNAPERLIELVQTIPDRIRTSGYLHWIDPVEIRPTYAEADAMLSETITERVAERVRAAWTPIPEVGSYVWDVWRDRDDPTVQVAEPADRTRFALPIGLERTGTIPPYGMKPTQTIHPGQSILVGFAWGTVQTRMFDHDGTGRFRFVVSIPPYYAHPTPANPTGSGLIEVVRDYAAGLPVPAVEAELGSHRTIDQSPGHPYGDPR